MTGIDWAVLTVYIFLILLMGYWVGRRQESREDYYLGGRRMPSWQIALSIVATQVSAISLIGAPAFIAVRSGGGLIWLQYEFAIPLAMMFIMLTLVPIYHRIKAITIYEYLEHRFGTATRTVISLVFLLSRGLGSGVALLATGIVTAVCLNLPLYETILLIGVVSILYTTFGGIKADIYSDILQLIILWSGAFLAIGILWNLLGDQALVFSASETHRLQVFQLQATGWGDGQTFGFWPMLIGGFFLYLSYYGCDQSQSQRLLTTATPAEAQKALLLNGLLRFPLVLTYSTVGILLIPFLRLHPDFANQLVGKQPDFLVPYFLIEYMPTGLLGLLIAGIFAASMSSLDSAMNSLSAATYQDFLIKIRPSLRNLSNRQQVRLSRGLTIFWGTVSTLFALEMIGGSETVLELVNKIGSAFYGPILAVFWMGMLNRTMTQTGAISGLLTGVLTNIYLWQFHSQTISWLWWNVVGFLVSFLVGYAVSHLDTRNRTAVDAALLLTPADLVTIWKSHRRYFLLLLAAFLLILTISFVLEQQLGTPGDLTLNVF
ncbi:MAG: sodium/solute symporter [Calditrichaeota bacterium]|nr:sodium/solute symporter [Calditrichota bacterium]